MSETLAATPYQAMHLLASVIADKDAHGTNVWSLSFNGSFSQDRLNSAWREMLRRHPPLMLRFRNDGGTIFQELRSLEELPDESARIHWAQVPPDPARGHVDGFAPFGSKLIQGWVLGQASDLTRVVIAAHHSLVDEESFLVAARTLMNALAGEGSETDNESVASYRHRVRALLSAAERARYGESRQYWRRLLEVHATPAVPQWPGTHSGAHAGRGRYDRDLDEQAFDAVRVTARRNRVTLAMIVHAAVAIVWYRYGLGERISVGTPLTLRDHPDIGFETTGLFLNVLPIVTELSATDTFEEVLLRLRREVVAIQDHKFTSLTDLATITGVHRSSIAHSATSYFGSTLSVRLGSPPSPPGMRVRSLGQTNPGSMLHIDVAGHQGGCRITLSWQDGCHLWPSPADIVSHVLHVIELMGNDPTTKVGGFPLVSEPHTMRLIGTGGTRVARVGPTPHYVSVLAAVEEQWRRRPSDLAIVDPPTSWTLTDLHCAVRDARALLRAKGPRAGDRIGVACGRSRWQIVFALACWSEGLCYVPLDLEGPTMRTRLICRDADLRIIVARRPPLGDVDRERPYEVVSPEQADRLAMREGDRSAKPEVQDVARHPLPTDPAYVMYTSGSSGMPKGVVITHGNLTSFMNAFADAFPGTRVGSWLAETAPTFDISLLEMFWPLINGQPVVISGSDGDGSHAGRSLRFTHRQCTPSRAQQVLNARQTGEDVGHWYVSPRTWLIGGEVLPAALLRELRAAYPATTFFNMYGPTEATIWSTFHIATGDVEHEVPIGAPLGNSSLMVLDRCGHPAPLGVVGELLVAGGGVSPGYLGRSDIDARVFGNMDIWDQTVPTYRTGDLVVVGPGGQLYFRGRNDRQVKLLGHRIELEEIERVLTNDPDVSEAVVALHAHGTGKALCAYVTRRPGRSVDEAAVRRRLTQAFSNVMVPTRIVVLKAFARLPSGKIDRDRVSRSCVAGGAAADAASTALADGRPASSAARDGGLTACTAVVLEAIQRILGHEVGPDDDFFAVGGNSLSALVLVAKAQQSGLSLRLRDVLKHRTASSIATHIEAVRRG